ncbi:hypothetical protein PV04_03054 [Phialophora macrospora]|uniref:Uncharacterized protein n=1 Tax=Phialophora macrospora TaxID=1851006 RepID=A0A0D2FWF2_9EURO|nr:hypothetical protein PV04_03054 [Phialophora macrospora]
MAFRSLSAMTVGGLAVVIGCTLIEATRQNKALSAKQQDECLEAPLQARLDRTPDALNTSSVEPNTLTKSQDVSIKDASQENEVDTAGSVLSLDTLEEVIDTEASVTSLILRGYLEDDTEEPTSGDEDAPHVQDSEALVPYGPTSTAMTLYRPFTYLHTSTHLITRSQPPLSVSSHLSKSTRLVLHGFPAHLGVTFIYHQVWDRLLVDTASPTEKFWKGVLRRSCARNYRKCFALDGLASLHQSDVEDIDLTRRLEGVSGAAEVAIPVVEENHVQPGDSSLKSDDGDTSGMIQGLCHVFSENEDSFTSAGDSTPPTSHGDAIESLMVEGHCDDSLKVDTPGGPTSQLTASEETPSCGLGEQAINKRQLEEELHHQQFLSSGLRSQLVDCEERLEDTQAKLREAEHQRRLYEAESDETSQQVLKLQQELAFIKRQLADEKNVSSVPSQSHRVANPAVAAGFNVPAIMASYSHACEVAKTATADSEYVRGMLQEVIKERDYLNRQLHQKDCCVNEVSQRLQGQLSQANDLNAHLRDNIGGLEGQINHLLQAKEVSDELNAGLKAHVTELAANNQTLLHDFTNKLIADPQDIIDPVKCTYNEARDLRNQIESAQATSAQFAKANQSLSKELQQEKEKSSSLQTDRDLLNNKCARLAANYEVLEDKVEHWMETLPRVLRRRPEVSEEEHAAWKEDYFLQSRAHVVKTKRKLKAAALDVSNLEAKLATMERKHKAEVAHLEGSVSELTSKNVELEAENFNLGLNLHDAQGQVELLQSQLARSNQAGQRWKEQCESHVWGDTAAIVRNAHRDEVETLKDQNHALQHMNTELRLGKEVAARDVSLFKWNFAETITRMREFEAEWEFARAKTDALEERFAEELRKEPLRIQRRDAFEEMSLEQKQQLLRTEDAWIVIATGINLGRGDDGDRASPAMGVWEAFMAEVKAHQENRDKVASEDPGSKS